MKSSRPTYAFAAICIIAVGLFLRLVPLGLPAFFVKYGGSVLWGAMVYALVGLCFIGTRISVLMGVALTIAISTEFLRLYHTPDLDAFRLTLPGALLLGRIFSLWNILAYGIGIVSAACVDELARRKREALACPQRTSPPRIAIFGATSDIAVATARIWAKCRFRLVLVSRKSAALADVADELSALGADVVTMEENFALLHRLDGLVEEVWSRHDGLDAALIAYGMLPDQSKTEQDSSLLQETILVNFTSPAVLANCLALRFEAQGSGTIAVITSVAGDRGRRSNYAYGATKGGLQRFLEGLRHRLQSASVHVLDIRSGLVSTKMTAHRSQNRMIWARPEQVAASIVQAINRRQDVLYTPRFWRFVMWIVRSMPRALFHRTRA